MDALISGRAGVAIVVDGDRLASIHSAEPEGTISREPQELHYLAGEVRDFITVEDVSRAEVILELIRARRRDEGLNLILILQDPELGGDVREQAASELEKNLDDALAVDLENVLFAAPLPPEADLEGGLSIARSLRTRRVESLLDRLRSHQEAIREIRAAWEAIPERFFGDQQQTWQSVAVRQGCFRDLVLNRSARRTANDFFVTAVMNARLRSLPNQRSILQAWSDPFREHSDVSREYRAPIGTQPSEIRQHAVPYRTRQSDREFVESGQKPGNGTYCCTLCHWKVELTDSDRLPPCGNCGRGQSSHYRRC